MKKMRGFLVAFALISGGSALAEDSAAPFRLGVQTHFEQGWHPGLITRAEELGAPALRDEIGWRDVEKSSGVYDFSVSDRYLLGILEKGMTPLIVLTDTNPLYDAGKTPHSAAGREGLAAYASAIMSRYGPDKVLIEIGNEVNSDEFSSGPFAQNKPAYFAASVRAVSRKIRAEHPGAKIICAGLNTVAIGFFRDFFRRGGLQDCDAISVHPYRDNPDTVSREILRLKELMREYGGEKPIYVTEFGKWFEDQDNAPDYMLKMVAQLASLGVAEAYWYALLDEPWWPNMGLYEANGRTSKPAADAFKFLQTSLLPLGRPIARSDDTTVRLFEFGQGGRGFVAWGSGGQLQVSGDASFFDTRGRAIPQVTQLSDTPVVILGDNLTVTASETNVVADTKYQYNQLPWSYFALRPDIGLTPLETIDWNWTSYRGAPDLSPLQVGDKSITTARFQGKPYHAIERFTATETGSYLIEGWWQASPNTEPSRLIVRHNRKTIASIDTVTPEKNGLPELRIDLEAGDTVDFELAPTGPDGNGTVQRRIRILHAPSEN